VGPLDRANLHHWTKLKNKKLDIYVGGILKCLALMLQHVLAVDSCKHWYTIHNSINMFINP
jgi:hypothetical protein